MLGLLGKIWNGIKAVPGLIFPFLAKAVNVRGWKPWVLWTVHVLLILLVLVGLGYLNYLFDIGKLLRAPYPLLRKVWLPLLFLLIYILAWLGWWLWQLLGPEEKTTPFPDIDAAWKEAMQALDQAGIDLTEAPLFLLLGEPHGTEETLLAAAQLPLQVRHVPRDTDAPLHVSASREGIYVTCPGASLLGRQAALLLEEAEEKASGEPSTAPVAAPAPEPQASLMPRSRGRLLDWRSLGGSLAERKTEELPEAPAATEGQPVAVEPELEQAQPVIKRRVSLLQNAEEVELLTDRLRHLCQLIARGRQPYCPLNGILILLPWAATDNDSAAQQTGRIVLRDLTTIRQMLQVQCPVFALLCDMEEVPGFREVLERLPVKQRQHRLGLAFPLVPDLEPDEIPGMIASGVHWIVDTLFPTLIYKLFRLDVQPGAAPRAETLSGNIRLYQLLWQMRERQQRLTWLLNRGYPPDGGLPFFGGCYLAATGRDPAHEQAFVAGVFPLLTDNQNYVSWTDEALAEEATFRRWTVLGYVGLSAFVVVLLILAYFYWPWP